MPEDEAEDAPFLAGWSVAAVATTMLWASIILPMTPPVLLAVVIEHRDSRPSCCAVIFCRLPNRAFELVSDPVRATPSQPSSAAKNG